MSQGLEKRLGGRFWGWHTGQGAVLDGAKRLAGFIPPPPPPQMGGGGPLPPPPFQAQTQKPQSLKRAQYIAPLFITQGAAFLESSSAQA